MKLRDALKFMFYLFCTITTFEVLFVATVSLVDSAEVAFDAWDLYKLTAVALAGVLPVLVFVRKEAASRAEDLARRAVHFALTAAAVSGLLILFGWMDATNAALIVAFFLAIYIPAYIVNDVRAKRLADRLNERITAFHDAENETRDSGA